MCGRYSFAQLSQEVEKRFKIKGVDPVFTVAGDAIFHGDFPDNIIGIFGLGMEAARSMTNFTS